MKRIIGTCLCFVILNTISIQANEWNQWRGPTRDGVDPNSPPLLDTWPEKGPKLVWKSDIKVPNGRDGG